MTVSTMITIMTVTKIYSATAQMLDLVNFLLWQVLIKKNTKNLFRVVEILFLNFLFNLGRCLFERSPNQPERSTPLCGSNHRRKVSLVSCPLFQTVGNFINFKILN